MTQTDAVRVLASGVSRPAARHVSRQRTPPGNNCRAWHMPCSAAHTVRRVRGAGWCRGLVVVVGAGGGARGEEGGARGRGAGGGAGSEGASLGSQTTRLN